MPAALKLCALPPTSVAFEQNVRRVQYQSALWYNTLTGNIPALEPTEYGWEKDETNYVLVPRNVAEGVSGCMGHQMPCTLFCACGGIVRCSNPFNIGLVDVEIGSESL